MDRAKNIKVSTDYFDVQFFHLNDDGENDENKENILKKRGT